MRISKRFTTLQMDADLTIKLYKVRQGFMQRHVANLCIFQTPHGSDSNKIYIHVHKFDMEGHVHDKSIIVLFDIRTQDWHTIKSDLSLCEKPVCIHATIHKHNTRLHLVSIGKRLKTIYPN